MLNFFPKYFTNKAIALYIIVLFFVSFIFSDFILPSMFIISGFIGIILFFYFSNLLTKRWSELTDEIFVKKLFFTAFFLRAIWVIFSYFFYLYSTGLPFEWGTADAMGYHNLAIWLRKLIESGEISKFFDYFAGRYSDTGYATYLGFQYYLTGDSILIARLFKALFGAFTAVFIYNLTKRTFGEPIGRMASIFVMLMPNLILYTGLHLKEVEMLFLISWFMERADALLRNKKFSFNTLWLPVLLVLMLFFFRTVLGVTALFALFSALFLSNERSVKLGKRILASIWFVVAILYFVGSQYFGEIDEVWNKRQESQSKSMEWRSVRKDGSNSFAKYASTAVFAPLIFVIPFPTIVNIRNQENQMIINGGNYVKNVMAFFVLFALFRFIKEKRIRDYLLIISFVLSYLAVIAMSAFAHAERFHQPVVPFLLILAAVGISKITNREKGYFSVYLFFIFIAIIGWSWFKLSGRGLL